MSQLKEQNGRYYQECEVVMIATNTKTVIQLDKDYNLLSIIPLQIRNSQDYQGQHLYILSNEEIKEGDWGHYRNRIFQITKGDNELFHLAKKIIVTTDESLGNMVSYLKIGKAMKGNWKALSQPSESFIKKYIEEYNKGNVITKVLVHLNNQITIKKVKNTWTTEDLTGNGIKSLDQFLLNSPDFTQEEREIIMDAVSQYTNKS